MPKTTNQNNHKEKNNPSDRNLPSDESSGSSGYYVHRFLQGHVPWTLHPPATGPIIQVGNKLWDAFTLEIMADAV